MEKTALVRDFIGFLAARGKVWLIVPVLIFFLLGALLVPVEGSVVAPLIYPLF